MASAAIYPARVSSEIVTFAPHRQNREKTAMPFNGKSFESGTFLKNPA
jgi:hypothetical protein